MGQGLGFGFRQHGKGRHERRPPFARTAIANLFEDMVNRGGVILIFRDDIFESRADKFCIHRVASEATIFRSHDFIANCRIRRNFPRTARSLAIHINRQTDRVRRARPTWDRRFRLEYGPQAWFWPAAHKRS